MSIQRSSPACASTLASEPRFGSVSSAMRLWWMCRPPDAQVLEARAQRSRAHDIPWVPARHRDPSRARAWLNPVPLCRRPERASKFAVVALSLRHRRPMTLRIATSQDSEGTIVMIAGRLGAEEISELERVMSGLSGPLRLDLAGLRSADEAGLEMLRALRSRGISLLRVSPYHRLLLADGPPRKAPSPSFRQRGHLEIRRSDAVVPEAVETRRGTPCSGLQLPREEDRDARSHQTCHRHAMHAALAERRRRRRPRSAPRPLGEGHPRARCPQ